MQAVASFNRSYYLIDMDNSHKDIIETALHAAQKAGADGADVTFITGGSTDIQVRKGQVESAERAEDFQLGLRVFCGKRNAAVSTGQLDTDNISRLAERAVAMAKIAPEDPYARLAQKEEQAEQIPELELCDSTILSTDALTEMALSCEAAALNVSGITNSDGGSASASRTRILIGTSTGFSAEYERTNFGFSAVVIAERDGQMERDYDYSMAVYAEDLKAPEKVGQRAAERTLSRLGARKPQTGTYPIIYDTRVSRSIAGHLASAINGSAVARGTSFLKEQLGQQIMSDTIQIYDDPLLHRGSGSKCFDGETLPVQKRQMVEDGKLTGWLLDLATAAQLGMQPTGNASRSLSGPPSPSTSNFYIENSNIETADLIADIKAGFFVTEMMGSSVSLTTGDYSRGAAGFWIENGEICWPVAEATIAGNLKDMFLSMQAGNDREVNQSISAPSLYLPQMMVAGA